MENQPSITIVYNNRILALTILSFSMGRWISLFFPKNKQWDFFLLTFFYHSIFILFHWFLTLFIFLFLTLFADLQVYKFPYIRFPVVIFNYLPLVTPSSFTLSILFSYLFSYLPSYFSGLLTIGLHLSNNSIKAQVFRVFNFIKVLFSNDNPIIILFVLFPFISYFLRLSVFFLFLSWQ